MSTKSGASGALSVSAGMGDALAAVAADRCRAEAELLGLVQSAVLMVADGLLADKGVMSVDELSTSAQEGLRAMAKRLVVAEVVLLTGMGRQEAHDLVGIALTPPAVSGVAQGAMLRGEAPWGLVRSFWEAARHDTAETAARVALALFGTDPAAAAVERLGSDGQLHGRPWGRTDFTAALTRELTRFRDPEVDRARARSVHERRHVWLDANPDGSATFTANGPLTTWVGAHARIDRAARRLKTEGDSRTLPQLRHDLTAALLHYGTLPLPQDAKDGSASGTAPETASPSVPGASPATPPAMSGAAPGPTPEAAREGLPPIASSPLFGPDLDVEEMDRLAAVLAAQGPVALQVIVPVTDLLPPPSDDLTRPSDDLLPRPSDDLTRPSDDLTRPSDDLLPEPREGAGARSAQDELRPGQRAGARDASARRKPAAPRRDGVGELVGRAPAFLHAAAVRRLALTPGTTIHRLLSDPADGRCVERTIRGYHPDADMRRQVIAADVYSRAPGSRVPASSADLDHVTSWVHPQSLYPDLPDDAPPPWSTGTGVTAETNLQALDRGTHLLKTAGQWTAAIGTGRDVTWTTLLGQVITTRPHDYRQYLSADAAAHLPAADLGLLEDADQLCAELHSDVTAAGGYDAWLSSHDDPAEARARANRTLYAVLLSRGPQALLAHPEDGDPLDTTHDGWLGVPSATRAVMSAARSRPPRGSAAQSAPPPREAGGSLRSGWTGPGGGPVGRTHPTAPPF